MVTCILEVSIKLLKIIILQQIQSLYYLVPPLNLQKGFNKASILSQSFKFKEAFSFVDYNKVLVLENEVIQEMICFFDQIQSIN